MISLSKYRMMHAQADGEGRGGGAGAGGISDKDLIFLGLKPQEDRIAVLRNIANALYNYAFALQACVDIDGESDDVVWAFVHIRNGDRNLNDVTLGNALDATVRAIVIQMFRISVNTMRPPGSMMRTTHDMANVVLQSYTKYSAIARLQRLVQTFPTRFADSNVFILPPLFLGPYNCRIKISQHPYTYTQHVKDNDFSTVC